MPADKKRNTTGAEFYGALLLLRNKKVNKTGWLKSIISVVLWLAIWQAVAMLIGKPVYLPTFTQSLTALSRLITEGSFLLQAFGSFGRVIGGYTGAAILGLILALVCAFIPAVESFVAVGMNVVKTTPVASFILLALVFMNTSLVPAFVCLLLVLPIVYENTLTGIRSIPTELIDVCRIYNIPKSRFILNILPHQLGSYVFSALRSGLGMGWKAAVSAEVIARPALALGTVLYNSKIYIETEELFACTLFVIILSTLTEALLRQLTKTLDRRTTEKGEAER